MNTDKNDASNIEDYEVERAAYKTVDLLLPEKEPLAPEGKFDVVFLAITNCVFFGAMALIIGARSWWLLFWVAVGAAFAASVFLNAAHHPFHDIDRAWRYLCLRCSTQVGWLIIGLVAYIIWR